MTNYRLENGETLTVTIAPSGRADLPWEVHIETLISDARYLTRGDYDTVRDKANRAGVRMVEERRKWCMAIA